MLPGERIVMNKRTSSFAIGIAFVLAACGSSRSSPRPHTECSAAGPWTPGSDVSSPPQEFFAVGSTTATGFDIDLGKALADQLGLQFAVVNTPFDGIIPA